MNDENDCQGTDVADQATETLTEQGTVSQETQSGFIGPSFDSGSGYRAR